MKALINEIRELIRSARQAVVKSVDLIQELTNFEIGRCIIEYEQQGAARAGYGERTLKEIALALTEEFGRGFSLTNLKMMRKFYLTYQNRISQTASGLLPSSQKGQTVSDLFAYGRNRVPEIGSFRATNPIHRNMHHAAADLLHGGFVQINA